MNMLFVCSMNQWRSPTAEKIYAKHDGLNVRSAGTSSKARRKVTADDLKWADVICVMEYKHKSQLKSRFPGELQILTVHVLDIPDEYRFMDPELVTCIRESVDSLLID